ncbi:hypothetical protein [Allocoleopsis sp.]|uniref:hypothetical protein n=1 Tax=Allocoleopsis sp. TaxID=3088169 RepID=UPI002FD4499B
MLTATYPELKVNVAPNVKEHVIGIGEETRAIAVEIMNMGQKPLKFLTMKYQAGMGGQWFDLITNAKGYTTQTTVLRKWNGENPYNLGAGKKAVLYFDVSEIWALKIDMQCEGDRNSFPLPETKVAINAYALKNLGIIGGAVAPVSQTGVGGTVSTPNFVNTSDTGRVGKGSITKASSITVMNIGTKIGTIQTTQGVENLPAGATVGWSANAGEIVGDIYYDATGTNFLITFLDGTHTEGTNTLAEPISDESGQSLTDESDQPLTM